MGNVYFYPVALAQLYLPLAPGPSDHEISRPRPHSPGVPSPEHEAYLKALDYAIEAGLEGTAVGCYVKRMTYGEYLVATGPDASEEVLGWDIWVVAVACNTAYRGFGVEHMPRDQRTINYVAIAMARARKPPQTRPGALHPTKDHIDRTAQDASMPSVRSWEWAQTPLGI